MKNASRLPFGMAFFCAQVLDFYRRPMLYYYNDCKCVHFQHGGPGRRASDTGGQSWTGYHLRRKIENEFTGGKIREEHGKADD